MPQMPDMPEIKPEVFKEKEEDKKKGGFLARLFGGGSSGGAMGSGSMGGGGFGSLLSGGGIMATKAGLLAFIVAGSTVAAGIGLVGYRLFGPGQDSGSGDNLSVFQPRPKEARSSEGAVAADGSSASLKYLADANQTPKAPDAVATDPTKDATAASAASDAAAAAARAAAAKGAGPINAAGNSGNGVNRGLKGATTFGKLTSAFGGGSGVSGGSSASAGGNGKSPAELNAARGGSLSGMNRNSRAESGGGRAIAARRSNSAKAQAFRANNDGRTAQTSYAAGRTFDGSNAPTGDNAGANSQIAGNSPPTADGGQPKSLPANQNLDSKKNDPPPVPNATKAAPWQKAINAAQMMLAAGALLLYIMGKIKIPWVRYAIGAIVLAMSLAIVALGGKISGGEWGQKLQGGVLAAAGVGLGVAAVMSMMATSDATGSDGKISEDAMKTSGDAMGSAYVLLGGGAALIGIAGVQLNPPAKHPLSDFNNSKPPDIGAREFPSERALRKMIA
jgi:hypothetical protein